MNFSDIAILNIKGSDYRCIISGISKSEAINLMQNADLTKKKRNIIKYTIHYLTQEWLRKNKLYRHKSPIFLKDVNIEKVLL